jgi:hypothetical protein
MIGGVGSSVMTVELFWGQFHYYFYNGAITDEPTPPIIPFPLTLLSQFTPRT